MSCNLYLFLQGKISAQGTPTDLARRERELVAPPENDTDNCDELDEFVRRVSHQIAPRSISATSTFSGLDQTISEENDDDVDKHDEELQGAQLEASSKGMIKGSKTMHYFKAGAHWSVLVVLLLSVLATQMIASAADIWVSIW